MVIDMTKKLYLILFGRLNGIGGGRLYVAGKVEYLKKLGWEVQCFSEMYCSREDSSIVPLFNEYIKKGNGEFTFLQMPPYRFRKEEQELFLNLLIAQIGISNLNDYEIIVESCDCTLHFWGELLAARIGARHFCVMYHENYWQTYYDNREFFYFKWKRNELIAFDKALKLAFKGYKNMINTLYDMPNTIHEADPIKDVDFPIDKIPKRDYNICHIGRIEKNYVPYVIEGVAEFAKRHPDKTISFIFVGKIDERKNFIIKTLGQIDNVELIALGDMYPIPRILFSKIDVVCAISHSAHLAANEGTLTIVGIADNPQRTPGVLGYDTEKIVFGEGNFSYVEALENVLVKRLYDGKKYSLPKLKPAEEYYKDFWTIVQNAAPTKEYYIERISQERIRNWSAIFPFGAVARGARIILFGETQIARDYLQQIQSQENIQVEYGSDYIKQIVPKPYCTIVATIDEHPEEFDGSVTGIERLKQKDYDAIIISTYPQQAQDAYNKIVQIVPEMANRIIYRFNVLQI